MLPLPEFWFISLWLLIIDTMMKRIYLMVVFLTLQLNVALGQCAMCKAVAESNMNGGDSMASGLNNGIVFLMFIPYLLIGTVAYLIYKHRKKTAKSSQEVG